MRKYYVKQITPTIMQRKEEKKTQQIATIEVYLLNLLFSFTIYFLLLLSEMFVRISKFYLLLHLLLISVSIVFATYIVYQAKFIFLFKFENLKLVKIKIENLKKKLNEK